MASELRVVGLLQDDRSAEKGRPGRPSIVQVANPAVSTHNVNVRYGSFLALRNVSISAPVGEITAIIGPSGCGKSTLLRSLNRINDLIPSFTLEGEVLMGDQNVYAPDVDVATLRRRVGMLFQRPAPFPMSIYDNVVYSLRLDGRPSKSRARRNRRALSPTDGTLERGEGSSQGAGNRSLGRSAAAPLPCSNSGRPGAR